MEKIRYKGQVYVRLDADIKAEAKAAYSDLRKIWSDIGDVSRVFADEPGWEDVRRAALKFYNDCDKLLGMIKKKL